MAIAYRKCGINARVFSETLEHGNGKNQIRQRNRRSIETMRRVWKEYENMESVHEKNTRRHPNYIARPTVPPRSHLPESVDELADEPNLHMQSIHHPLGRFKRCSRTQNQLRLNKKL